ncbi:MAG TPA: hypothetical protein VIJ00_02865, partial [Nakamurella sp.]
LTAGPARRPATARPAPAHRGETGPFVAGGPSGPGGQVLLLERQAGNAAVQTMLGPATALTVSRQKVPPAYTAPPPGSPPPAGPAAAPAVTLNGATPLEQAADGFTQATPAALDQAWGLLNSRAMFDLLPMLAGLKTKGFWSVITADATPRGGPRMANAVHTVDLKTKGSPITKDELRELIDRMADMFPDQRADMLRFIGKYVVLTVDGIDLDFSYVAGATSASCVKEVQDEIGQAKFFIKEYAAAGKKKGVKTGAQVEEAVKDSLAKQGFGVAVAGSTSSTGAITITATPMTKAQPILTRNTEIHESVHSHHVAALQKTFGRGTPGFKAAFNDAQDWVRDEINARKAEIKFLTKVVAALKKLEKMIK